MAAVFENVPDVDDWLWDLVDSLEDAGDGDVSERFWRVNDAVYYYTEALKGVK